MPGTDKSHSARVGGLLKQRGWRLAVAESATGGLLGHTLTEVPGASAYFWGGLAAYANDIKERLLQVRAESLLRWGAVSAPVALEMACGAQRVFDVEVSLSITGIAGPGGGSVEKPVGLYFVGLAVPRACWVWRHQLSGSRSENNRAVTKTALLHLITYLGGAGCEF